jgi:dynein heavy chain
LNDRFKEMMKNLYTKKNVTSICREGCTTSVDEMTLQMEEIQKSLDNYLEMKRKAFPRFYFISDDDLLELIGKSKEPEQVQKHMKKCFEGVDSLMLEKKCDGDTYCATGVKASDGETLGFVTNVAIDGSIEVWLRKVLDEVQLSVKRSLDGCTKGLKSAKKETWVREWQGQVLITAGAISWTRGCARALELIESGRDKHALRSYRKKQVSLLRRLTEMVRDSSQQRIDRSKIVALITMEVHNRDVVEKLLRSGCQDPNDFTWTSQLRFLMEKGDDYATCTVRQTYCQLSYGYEYQGNNGRLVVTPLTDRCVLTLITAKFLHRGGNPLGPAGTGKTETVKDLAKNLAYFCVVSNCSEAMDFKSVGRIFSGLCQSGAWGCFDEFNRIKVEVISVVAMQISAILNALRCNESVFNFMGSKINCSPHTGIFITMNPGYAGRTELPDNLKALMRPVAMMAPDLNLIAEVILSAEGFANSRVLAKKSITLYNLMQQQLSKQSHYDYGLRSIKGVLTMAGTLKRTENDIDEEQIIIRAVKCMNEPKFVKDDLTLFYLLLSDLFPNRNMEKTHAGQLQDVIEQSLVENNLQVVEYAVQKTLELAYSMNIRHCNMIIGETLTGKTSIWQTLCSAKQLLPTDNDHYTSSVNKCIINPKALNIKELYGSYDLVTFEWTDGVISSIFKNFSESSKHDVEKWLIFDGPVDALWIESMNSVMDDNKILTLVNGDRISLAASMSLLFEVENLSVASPATVSRAGMIYIDGHIGWKPFLQSWLDKNIDLFQGSRTIIDELCDKVSLLLIYYLFSFVQITNNTSSTCLTSTI